MLNHQVARVVLHEQLTAPQLPDWLAAAEPGKATGYHRSLLGEAPLLFDQTGNRPQPRYLSNYVGLRNRLSVLNEQYPYVDFETRVDFRRLHRYRLGRAKQALSACFVNPAAIESDIAGRLDQLERRRHGPLGPLQPG